MYDLSIKLYYIIIIIECFSLIFFGKFCNLLGGKVDILSNMSGIYKKFILLF